MSVVNVGAGTGSYEPRDRQVTAVEPSAVMIAQRPQGAAPAVQAVAEQLPFADNSFDAAMAILTLHHWGDLAAGLAEMVRVARRRVVIVTFDLDVNHNLWIVRDYLPEVVSSNARWVPTLARGDSPTHARPSRLHGSNVRHALGQTGGVPRSSGSRRDVAVASDSSAGGCTSTQSAPPRSCLGHVGRAVRASPQGSGMGRRPPPGTSRTARIDLGGGHGWAKQCALRECQDAMKVGPSGISASSSSSVEPVRSSPEALAFSRTCRPSRLPASAALTPG
jgi:hypothetical protein